MGSFLHLFGYEKQVEICKRMVEILRPVSGSCTLGRQVGSLEAQSITHRTNAENTMFRHNPDSFAKMWEEVGEATGSKWRAEARLLEYNRPGGVIGPSAAVPGSRLIEFAAFRL